MLRFFLFLFLVSLSNQSFGNCERASDTSRIVSAGGSLTEIIYYLNASENLVARDLTSNYPPEATALPSIGYLRNLSAEGLLSLQPTLILGESDAGPPNILDQLRNLTVDFRIFAETYDGESIIHKTTCVGEILGVDDETLQVKLRKLRSDIKELKNTTSFDPKKKKILLILMMRGTSPIVAGSNTAGDGFIKMTGNLNAFDDVDGWKPVGVENILSVDPDAIIVTTRSLSEFKNTDEFLTQTRLNLTKAGKTRNLIVADTMEMLGFGPRTPSLASKISSQLQRQ